MEYMEFAMDRQIEGAQSENARLADENIELTAENAKLREQLADLQRIIKYIDKKFPRADETCDEPGITLSEAVRRTLAEKGK